MLPVKLLCPTHTTQYLLDFGHFISLDGMNSELLLFNKYKNEHFSFLPAGFCVKNLAFARKNNGFARLRGTAWAAAPASCFVCL